VQAALPRTRAVALEKLWSAAKTSSRSAGAIYRYVGALGSLAGDARTRMALERAREADSADRQVWFLLSYDYAKAGESAAAEGAALVGEGLEADADERDDQARMLLERALPLIKQPSARAFVLSHLGDGAAARDDWATAEQRYRAAIDLREKLKDNGNRAIDAPKLARAQVQQGEQAQACATLQRARKAGIDTLAAQIARLCGQG
jgi:hypothetical protein